MKIIRDSSEILWWVAEQNEGGFKEFQVVQRGTKKLRKQFPHHNLTLSAHFALRANEQFLTILRFSIQNYKLFVCAQLTVNLETRAAWFTTLWSRFHHPYHLMPTRNVLNWIIILVRFLLQKMLCQILQAEYIGVHFATILQNGGACIACIMIACIMIESIERTVWTWEGGGVREKMLGSKNWLMAMTRLVFLFIFHSK